jgi:hypothetical protein
MPYNFNIGVVYNFNTTASSILGTEIKYAKLIGILNYESALQYENIYLKYRNIYPLLPNGTPNSPETSIYYLFLSQSGEKFVFADIWIDHNSVTVVNEIALRINLTGVQLSDIQVLRNMLNAGGYLQYEIQQVTI